MAGVLSIETVIEPRNKGAKQVLLLKAGLAGIELCGIHKHHHTDPEVEPNMKKVIPEMCTGVWLHKVKDTCGRTIAVMYDLNRRALTAYHQKFQT